MFFVLFAFFLSKKRYVLNK